MTLLLAPALLLVAWFARPGWDRAAQMQRYLLVPLVLTAGLMLWAHDWTLLAGWLVLSVNALRKPWPIQHLAKVQTLGLLYAGWIVLDPEVDHQFTVLALGLLVSLGLGLVGLWAWTDWPINQNHREMALVTAMACTISLGFLWSWWGGLVVPFLALPLARRRTVQAQPILWLGVVGLTVLGLFLPWLAVLLGGVVVIELRRRCWGWRIMRNAPDHNRLRMWCILLILWKAHGWRVWLGGLGWESWKQIADQFNQLEQQKRTEPIPSHELLTHPHNEYVWMLFEHGALGLAALLAVLLNLGWHAEPALLVPGVALCAMAATSFPWTLPYEVAHAGKQHITYEAFGSMGMVVVSWLIGLLLRGGV